MVITLVLLLLLRTLVIIITITTTVIITFVIILTTTSPEKYAILWLVYWPSPSSQRPLGWLPAQWYPLGMPPHHPC